MKKLLLSYSLELMTDDEDPNASVGVRVVGLDGCFSQGDTIDEAISNAEEAIQGWIKVARRMGVKVPRPPKKPRITITRNRSEWLTVGKASRLIGVSATTLRKIIASGDLPAFKFGNEFRIREIDLSMYQASARVTLAA